MNVFFSTISFKSRIYIPYASGCLISYCLKDQFFKDNVNFIEPEFRFDPLQYEDFHDRLKQSDVIGLTCFVWNQASNDKIAKIYKSYRPDGIVLYGGPNVPGQIDDAQEFANQKPDVDVFFFGPGEKNIKNFLQAYYNTRNIHGHEGTYTKDSYTVTNSKENYVVTETPTPYLDGIFDSILKRSYPGTGLAATIETNRGCPYRCAFCDWGSLTASKVYTFETDPIKQQIDYIMKHECINHINIIDANFGTFPRDVDIIDYLYESKIKHNKEILELSFGGMAKNGSRYLKDIYVKLDKFQVNIHGDDSKHAIKNMKVSLQTLSKQALETIDRKNIRTERLLESVGAVENKSLSSELIVGLPGETVDSWLYTLEEHVRLNLELINGYHLVVLPNTPMYDREYRKKHKIKYTRVYLPEDLVNLDLRVSAENWKSLFDYKTEYQFGKDEIYNFNTYEVMNSCYSYTNNELKQMYMYFFWFNTFWNSKLAAEHIRSSKMTVREQVLTFFDLVKQGKMPFFKKLVQDYQQILDKVFSTEEVLLDDLCSVTFLQKSMGRGTELLQIIENLDIAEKELAQIYPEIKLDAINTDVNKTRLLSSYFTFFQ